MISSLQREIYGLIPFTPKGSKESRVNAVTADIESGNVYLPDPRSCSWIDELIEECVNFPNGAHDDMVDALSMALLHFQSSASDYIRRLELALSS